MNGHKGPNKDTQSASSKEKYVPISAPGSFGFVHSMINIDDGGVGLTEGEVVGKGIVGNIVTGDLEGEKLGVDVGKAVVGDTDGNAVAPS